MIIKTPINLARYPRDFSAFQIAGRGKSYSRCDLTTPGSRGLNPADRPPAITLSSYLAARITVPVDDDCHAPVAACSKEGDRRRGRPCRALASLALPLPQFVQFEHPFRSFLVYRFDI